jgi:hypothetical protein
MGTIFYIAPTYFSVIISPFQAVDTKISVEYTTKNVGHNKYAYVVSSRVPMFRGGVKLV